MIRMCENGPVLVVTLKDAGIGGIPGTTPLVRLALRNLRSSIAQEYQKLDLWSNCTL